VTRCSRVTVFFRSRVVPFVIIAGTWLGPWQPAARAEAKLSILTRAWLTATISMPSTSALLEPRVQKAPPHREAGVIAAALAAAAHPAPPAALAPPERVYPEAVILRALRHGDSAFGRCWSRARREDIVAPRKARLHLEVDPTGVVRAAHTGLEEERDVQPAPGAESSSLPGCIAKVGRRLPFPATGRPMKLSLLLLR
jgi:hypothetical protein